MGRQEFLPETGAECTVVDGTADLEQPIGTAPRPAHLLRFVHATIDEEVGCSLGQRRADPQPGPVPFAIVDQMGALGAQVAVHRVQRPPQFASGRALARGQECMDALEGDPGILGFTVPGPLAQTLDLRGDRRPCLHPVRPVGRHASHRLLRVLESHGEMEPVQDRRVRDAGLGQDRPHAGACR